MLEKYEEKLKAMTDVLDNMPKNNKKNVQEYKSKVLEIKKAIIKLQEQTYNEIVKRYKTINDQKINPDLKTYDANLLYIKEKLYLLNDKNTSLAKSGLDKLLYSLDHFYKEDLININDTIILIINKFKEVGIILKKEEFTYSIYAFNYMSNFFIQKDNTINNENMKLIFENLYWKCPNIIKHIELNFRMLYRRYEKVFDDYFILARTRFLTESNLNEQQVKENINKLIIEKDYITSVDAKLLLNGFINDGWDIKQYEDGKIMQLYEKYIEDKKSSIEEYKIHNPDLRKLLNSLKEYKSYCDFKFIIDDVLTIYNEKDKYKSIIKEDLKKIDKNETKIKSLNTKYNKKSLFGKESNKTDLLLQINNTILETSTFYDEFVLNDFYEKVSLLMDSSSIYDLLFLVASNYIYLTHVIKKNNEEISEIDINNKIEELEAYLLRPYNTMIYNISIKEEVNMPMIISDHYKMFNINVPINTISEDSVNSLIDTITCILRYSDIIKSGIKVEDISFILDTNKNVPIEEGILENLIA